MLAAEVAVAEAAVADNALGELLALLEGAAGLARWCHGLLYCVVVLLSGVRFLRREGRLRDAAGSVVGTGR